VRVSSSAVTQNMTESLAKFEFPTSLQEYAVSAAEYLHQHPQFNVLCTGIVVFDKDGKMLLVQRAADERAFPDMWVSTACLLI
jgi:isopentenyldiphosphate isomerase